MPGFFDHSEIWLNQVLAGLVAGAVCGYLGVWVVLRRVVFVAAALGEVAGLGVVMAFFLALHFVPDPAPPAGQASAPRATVALSSPPAGPRSGRAADDAHDDARDDAGVGEPQAGVLSDDDLAAFLTEVGVEQAGQAMGTADAGASPEAGADGGAAAVARRGEVFDEQGVRAYAAPPTGAKRSGGSGGHAEPEVPPWLQPMAVAVVFVVVAASLLSATPRYRRITQESVVGFAYLAASGLLVLVAARIPQGTHEIRHVLYGDSVALDPGQLQVLLGTAGAVALLHVLMFKEFLFVSFDPETAQASGIRTRTVGLLLLVGIGVVIATASRAIGALPAFAFLVLPAVGALLCVSSLRAAFMLAATLGAAASFLGYYLAWVWNFPAGATRAVTAAVLVVPALVVRAVRGS
ncbi:MAG: metal ABC transporter permease [Deltaproteobacteria bacterium]|nr:metal ABC transporter permease [Deltaproteobacteria bacterium]